MGCRVRGFSLLVGTVFGRHLRVLELCKGDGCSVNVLYNVFSCRMTWKRAQVRKWLELLEGRGLVERRFFPVWVCGRFVYDKEVCVTTQAGLLLLEQFECVKQLYNGETLEATV